jgi:hypothetical protein
MMPPRRHRNHQRRNDYAGGRPVGSCAPGWCGRARSRGTCDTGRLWLRLRLRLWILLGQQEGKRRFTQIRRDNDCPPALASMSAPPAAISTPSPLARPCKNSKAVFGTAKKQEKKRRRDRPYATSCGLVHLRCGRGSRLQAARHLRVEDRWMSGSNPHRKIHTYQPTKTSIQCQRGAPVGRGAVSKKQSQRISADSPGSRESQEPRAKSQEPRV